MADVVSHVKDSYYFEVPKFLWRPKYLSLEDVPEFLTEAHPEASVGDFEEAMSGKVLIPQPFGATLKNLYEKESGFALSKFMVMELIAALLLVMIFIPLARRVRPGDTPKGR